MNLSDPPKTGNAKFDDWAMELVKFLRFPTFEAVRLTPRTAPTGDGAAEGVVYQDDAGNVLKAHNGTNFTNCNT